MATTSVFFRVAAMLGIFLSVCYGFLRARGEDAAHYLVMVAIFYTTLFVPRVTVTIEDHGSGAGAPVIVDNVPLGLAFLLQQQVILDTG